MRRRRVNAWDGSKFLLGAVVKLWYYLQSLVEIDGSRSGLVGTGLVGRKQAHDGRLWVQVL